MSDRNYPPLDFANVHGTAEHPVVVSVWPSNGKWLIAGHPNPQFNSPQDPPDGGHSDTIKFSGSSHISIQFHGALTGGREDCLDVNNGSHHISVFAETWVSGGRFVATLKGGSHDIYTHGHISIGGSETDIDLGNWSDQSAERTKFVMLNHTSSSGRVRVRVLNAWRPSFANPASNYRVSTSLKGLFYPLWALLKRVVWA